MSIDMNDIIDKAVYTEIAKQLTLNKEALSNLAFCFDSPKLYFDNNADRYDGRGFDGTEEEGRLAWIALLDELIESGDIIELDWKEYLEDFILQMKDLADKRLLNIEKEWFNEDEDISSWCKILDEKWEKQGFCVGAMDINSDSYVMFICQNEILKKLILLGKKIKKRFDLAKNM